MSRGGTRKERARQEAERRSRERNTRAHAKEASKRRRGDSLPKGRGRAALLHLSGFAAPLVLSFGLWRSGRPSNSTSAHWMGDLVDDPNASYFSELAGLGYAAAVFVVAAAVFAIIPVWLWRRLYSDHDVLFRDRTSVDGAFTMSVATAAVWLFRIVAGYNDSVAGFALIMMLLAAYVPVFSAILAIGMPVVPGSGRIGGILPGFLRFGFTERYLLSDEEREGLRVFKEIADRQEGSSD